MQSWRRRRPVHQTCFKQHQSFSSQWMLNHKRSDSSDRIRKVQLNATAVVLRLVGKPLISFKVLRRRPWIWLKDVEGCVCFQLFCIVCDLSSLVDLLKLMTSKKLQMPIFQLKLSQLHVPIWFIPPDRLFHHVDPGLWTIENSSVSNLCQSCTSPTFVGWTRAGPRRLHNGLRGAKKKN